jgi:putative tricarboxylic transport membrane protein
METAGSLVVLLIGVFILWQGRALSFGTLHAPGPGFFPTLIAAGLMILSFSQLVRTRRMKEQRASLPFFSAIRILMVFLALIVYFIFLEFLGFVIVSILLMFFLFWWIARQKWYSAFLSALLCIGFAYLLFELLLKGNLPKGALGF